MGQNQRQRKASPFGAEVASKINNEHRLANLRLGEALAHAVEAGKLLLKVRSDVEHGGWLPWVQSHCEFCPRTAQNYIRLAREHLTLPDGDAKRVSHLSIREALRALSPTAGNDETESVGTAVHFSSESDQWNTPKLVLERAVAMLGTIDLDPCSNDARTPNVPAAQHYTLKDDGLSREWKGRVFLNPPYGRTIGEWTGRLNESYRTQSVSEALALVPARTDARWFTELRPYHRCFIRGRLKFGDATNSAPFPSAVFYLGPRAEQFAETFADIGDVYALWPRE